MTDLVRGPSSATLVRHPSSGVSHEVRAGMGSAWRTYLAPTLFVAPGFLVYALFVLYPMGQAVLMSVFDYKVVAGAVSTFIGATNYIRAFYDQHLWLGLANSGIYMRCADRAKITDKSCYEANIFDQRPDQTYATGGIVHRGPVKTPVKAGGRWNTYEITMKGSELIVKLNGAETSRINNTELAGPGPIGLQFGNRGKDPGGAIKWRKVQIKEL